MKGRKVEVEVLVPQAVRQKSHDIHAQYHVIKLLGRSARHNRRSEEWQALWQLPSAASSSNYPTADQPNENTAYANILKY